MTAINFPASPNPGDKWPTTGNIDGKVWAWDGTTWKIVSTNGTVTIIDNTARSFAFTVTYTNVPGSYNVVGTDRNGEVNGLNPTITVNEEDTLIFNVNAAGHPFYLVWAHGGSSDQVGGGQGVNTASNQGTVNGTVTWVTDVGDGDALPTGELFYYQCGNHTNMYGTIKVLLKNTSDSASHIHDLIDLDDTPNAYDNGKYLKSTGTATEWATVTSGVDKLKDLSDTPTGYDNGKYLKSTATGTEWATVSGGGTYGVVTNQADGLAPQLPASHGGKFLKADGTWEVPPDTDTNTTYSNFNTSSSGLVPITPGGTTKFLRADGTWQVPTGGSGNGVADGNDYVTGATLSASKVLTLSFVNTSLNQTVDLASIDTDTTYSNFNTSDSGLVPQSPGGTTKYLRADGSWEVPPDTDTNTTYNVVSISADGLAPQLPASSTGKYLKDDGSWQTPPDTDTTYSNFNTSSAGLVPQSPGGTTKYLRADGSWVTVTSGGGDGNDYVTNLSLDGTILKAEFSSNSSLDQTIDLASIDTDTTYSDFTGTAAGLVPNGSSAGSTKFLRSDGTWQIPTNTTYNTFAGAGEGLVPNGSSAGSTKYLRSDGTWQIPTDTNTTYGVFSGSASGLVPNGSSAGSSKFLRSDGSWQTVATTTYSTFTGAGEGLVPNGSSAGSTKYLRSDGTWQIPTDTNTTYGVFSGSSSGLVPNGSSAGNDKFLKSDGTWDDVSSGGINISGSPNVAGAVLRWDGSNWEWSRTALIEGGTSSNNTNLVVYNNSNGYGGMEIKSNGEVLLKKAGTSYREGGHLQFEDHTFSNNDDTFAIDVYSDDGSNAKCCIRIIDQETNTQRFSVNHDGAWGIGHTNPDYGSMGEVMISRGSTLPPVWGNHGDISGSVFASSAQGATADTANAEIDHIYSQLNAIGNDDTITTVAQLKTALLALVRN